IRLLQNRADRMERMIQALLTFSRVNRLDLEQSEVDTEQLIWQTWQQINPEADQLLQLEGAFPVFTTYGLKLQHVFEQLLKNAVSFTSQPQAKITVTATESDDYYTFTVKDTGPGIPEEALPKVFSMFYTVTSKDKLDTTGAGLAIARKIVLFARGDIQIQSEVGKGTSVQFTWPKIITQNQQAS
ncbi:MAG: HAMP domain-containing histidine kinase, partial [Hymenobacteraceae bacterium]|nr:HAMP domain-containing histidine kinase [Hymenobacteraceae bacterium]MDX5395679.1 HAMP domain-containing histidine kinase [Hymenobacteraceae bacterium]MDX5511733.1 HAMP domain-containing histidine kinase [Hymenobacteraceae bacterium]